MKLRQCILVCAAMCFILLRAEATENKTITEPPAMEETNKTIDEMRDPVKGPTAGPNPLVTSGPGTDNTSVIVEDRADPVTRPPRPRRQTPASNGERALIDKLMTGYDIRVRPVRNASHAVKVQFAFTLNQILALDEKSQVMHTVIWARLTWIDEFLTWSPSEFDGLRSIHLKGEDIWRPDVVLANTVDSDKSPFEIFSVSEVIVNHDGVVQWNTPIVMSSMCTVQVEHYPFDEQSCPLTFGSWAYNGLKVDFTNKDPEASTSAYVPNVEWQLTGVPCRKHVSYFDCCPEPYPEVKCEVRIKRKPDFYMYNLVFPTILLIIIGTAVFCLPPESGEKISLATTILLAMSVFLLILMERVPANSDSVPLLGRYFGVTMTLLTLSTLMAIAVVNIHLKGPLTRPPKLVRRLVLRCLATVVFMRSETKTLNLEDEKADDDSEKKVSHSNPGMENMKGILKTKDNKAAVLRDDPPPRERLESRLLRRILAVLYTTSTRLATEKRDADRDACVEMEWKMTAMVLDRVFLFLHLIITVTAAVLILLGF